MIFLDKRSYRFDDEEPITHGVETLNHCEINVDVADVRAGSWQLKSEKDAHEKMSGKERNFHALMSKKYVQSIIKKMSPADIVYI